jgi:hypothetical protein
VFVLVASHSIETWCVERHMYTQVLVSILITAPETSDKTVNPLPDILDNRSQTNATMSH